MGGDNTFQRDRSDQTKRKIPNHILFKEDFKKYRGIELIRRFKIFLEDSVSYLDQNFRKKTFLHKTQRGETSACSHTVREMSLREN